MRKHIFALAFCICLAVPALAQATTYTWDFAGTLTSTSGVSGMSSGQSYTGTFTYSTDTLYSTTTGSGVTQNYYVTPVTMTITSGGQTYTSNMLLKYLTATPVLAENLAASGTVTLAGYIVGAGASGSFGQFMSTSSYTESLQAYFSFLDDSSGVASSSSAFSYVYHLAEQLSGSAATSLDINLAGSVTSFSQTAATPLPAAVWLLGSGLGALAWRRRKAAAA